MNRIKNFEAFSKSMSLQEADGFGTMPFLEKKDGNVYYYFFKLDPEKGEEQKGYMVSIGKYSEYEETPGAKNSYGVINANEIGPEIIDDIAVDKKEIPNLNKTPFKLSENELSRFFEQVGKTVADYLEQNPKVVRFYDEMQDNLETKNYLEYLKSVLVGSLGGEWSAQEGSSPKVVLISR